MYRFYINLLLLFIFLLLPAQAAVKKATIMVSGRTIADKAIVNKGVAYVPLGKVMSVLKANYKWDPSGRTLTVKGKPVTGKLLRYNGVYYISYLSVSQSTGLPVAYDTIYNKVYINPNMSVDDLIASFGGR